MLAKILAGVLAALAVTGVGVYYATDGGCGHKCSGTAPAPTTTSADGDCCATLCSADQPTDSSACCATKATTSCCAAKATSTDDLGACVGGMALTTAAPAPVGKSVRCCEE